MIIIGEKINGAIPSVAQAIKDRDASYIASLAKAQDEAGADYIDVCAGTAPDEEYDALCWLLEVVQEATSKPICLDSPDPNMLVKTMDKVQNPGILNSLSAEHSKCDILIPALVNYPEWSVMALCSGNEGVSATAGQKMKVGQIIMEQVEAAGISHERIFMDPLVLSASAVEGSAAEFFDVIPMIHQTWPGVKVAAAISNVSFGSPARGLMNHVYLAICLDRGLDAAIVDPLNRDVIGTIYTTNLLEGNDPHSRQYNKAFRKGLIGPVKK